MGIILDIIILAIMAISIFFGYKRGLVKVAVKLCAFLIAIIVTLVFYKPVSNVIIDKTELDDKSESIIIENGTKELEESDEEEQKNIIENMQEYVDNTVTQTQNEIVKNAAKEISVRLINILVIVGLFIATRLILILLVLISDLITSIPIIKQFNELGGVLYGIIRGLALIYAILAILFLIVSMSSNNAILTLIDSSMITQFMYENNILLNIQFSKYYLTVTILSALCYTILELLEY